MSAQSNKKVKNFIGSKL